ncbi:MAG TPA: sensor domain-containing diguanylate cyclase [Terracidiphilus sp.]
MEGSALTAAPVPLDEQARLQDLRSLAILDTPQEAAYDDLAQLAAFVCQVPLAFISLVDEDRQWFKARVGLGAAETPRSVSFCAHAILDDKVFVVPDAREDDRFSTNPLVTGDPGIRFYAGMPITGPGGHNLGTLCVIDRQPRELSDEDAVALRVLARQVASLFLIRKQVQELEEAARRHTQTEIRLRESQDRLRKMVRTDALTGLGNRRLFEERLRKEWKLAQRLHIPLSLLMIDVDHFKAINDQHGHATGDEVLSRIGRALDRTIRGSDTCARYGGEEFAILLPATGLAEAAGLAEGLRRTVADTPCAGLSVTISIGVACEQPSREDKESPRLIERADAALYAAKTAGRNRVESNAG